MPIEEKLKQGFEDFLNFANNQEIVNMMDDKSKQDLKDLNDFYGYLKKLSAEKSHNASEDEAPELIATDHVSHDGDPKKTMIWINGVFNQIKESILAQEKSIESFMKSQDSVKDKAYLRVVDLKDRNEKPRYTNETTRLAALNLALLEDEAYQIVQKKIDQARYEIKNLKAQIEHWERIFKIEQMSYQHQINAAIIPGEIRVKHCYGK